MKNILIVNNDLNIGGIQKSLINLLKSVNKKYNITLLLFSKNGVLLNQVPSNVKVISPSRKYSMLGVNKQELKKMPVLFCLKFILKLVSKLFSRRFALKLLGIGQKTYKEFDIAISYSHLPNHKCFLNGCGEFVLDKVEAKEKICIIHCDYLNSGCNTKVNNRIYCEFDKIACCSTSVMNNFIKGSGISKNVYVLRNFYDLSIRRINNKDPFDHKLVNIISVARLSKEKGIDIGIHALKKSKRKDICYYIIGDGTQNKKLKHMIMELGLENNVVLLGEVGNPYDYIYYADYLLVPSYHEAAPIVFDEANILSTRIISSNTLSSGEMLKETDIIFDIKNGIDELSNILCDLKADNDKKNIKYDNNIQNTMLELLLSSRGI